MGCHLLHEDGKSASSRCFHILLISFQVCSACDCVRICDTPTAGGFMNKNSICDSTETIYVIHSSCSIPWEFEGFNFSVKNWLHSKLITNILMYVCTMCNKMIGWDCTVPQTCALCLLLETLQLMLIFVVSEREREICKSTQHGTVNVYVLANCNHYGNKFISVQIQ